MRILGLVLAILGILALVYGGFSYRRERTILDVGGIKATATEQKRVNVPAVAGAIALVGGVALVVAAKRRA